MKVGYVRQFIVNVLVIPALLALWGCDQKNQEITQCFVPVEDSANRDDAVGGLILDPEKQCYGLKWSIPVAYEPFLFGTPVENLSITIGLVDQVPGAEMTEARKVRDKPEVSVYPQLANEFQERIAAVRKAGEETYGLKPTGGLMYGMEVYMSENPNAASRIIMFYPVVGGGSSMVVCNASVEQLVEAIDPLTPCTVTSYMDGYLFAEYNILYSLMTQLDLLNSVMIHQVLSFRVR